MSRSGISFFILYCRRLKSSIALFWMSSRTTVKIHAFQSENIINHCNKPNRQIFSSLPYRQQFSCVENEVCVFSADVLKKTSPTLSMNFVVSEEVLWFFYPVPIFDEIAGLLFPMHHTKRMFFTY